MDKNDYWVFKVFFLMFQFLFNSTLTVLLTATLIHDPEKSLLNTALAPFEKSHPWESFPYGVGGDWGGPLFPGPQQGSMMILA